MKKGLSLFSLLLTVSLVFAGCGGGHPPAQPLPPAGGTSY